MRQPLFARFLMFCLLSASAKPALCQIVFVGPASDPNCTYHSVQDAVNAWAASSSTETLSVFIANSQTYAGQAITIPTPVVPHPLNLRGDYAGCALSGPVGRAILNGAGGAAAPVIDIVGTGIGMAGRFEVTILNLEIIGGDVAAGDGGGIRLRGNATLTVFDSVVRNNQAQRGGGLALLSTPEGEPQLILGGNASPATFRDNVSSGDGAGLYCNDASIYCDRYCLIQGNHAAGNGGGVAQEGCETSLYPADSQTPLDPLVGVRGNIADGDGGGAWVSGGRFDLRAGALQPAPLVGNTAGGSGGGLYYTNGATGGGQGIQFDNNSAGASGGGLASVGGGFLIFDPAQFGKRCKDGLDFCARFRGNSAVANGGAIRLASGDLLLTEMLMDGNSAARGSVVDMAGTSGGVTLTNVHVSGNSVADELLYADGGYVDLRYTTIADNGSDDSALIRFAAAAQLTARNTLLHDDNGASSGVVLATVPGGTYNLSCLLVHENASLAGLGGSGVVAGDPQWDSSGSYPAGLFVPGADSPSVDACSFGPGSSPDLLNTPRPQDTPRPNGAGAFDMGAIERTVVPLIFRNGFEAPP